MAPVGLTTGGQQTQQIPTTGIYYPIGHLWMIHANISIRVVNERLA